MARVVKAVVWGEDARKIRNRVGDVTGILTYLSLPVKDSLVSAEKIAILADKLDNAANLLRVAADLALEAHDETLDIRRGT